MMSPIDIRGFVRALLWIILILIAVIVAILLAQGCITLPKVDPASTTTSPLPPEAQSNGVEALIGATAGALGAVAIVIWRFIKWRRKRLDPRDGRS